MQETEKNSLQNIKSTYSYLYKPQIHKLNHKNHKLTKGETIEAKSPGAIDSVVDILIF